MSELISSKARKESDKHHLVMDFWILTDRIEHPISILSFQYLNLIRTKCRSACCRSWRSHLHFILFLLMMNPADEKVALNTTSHAHIPRWRASSRWMGMDVDHHCPLLFILAFKENHPLLLRLETGSMSNGLTLLQNLCNFFWKKKKRWYASTIRVYLLKSH